jgi:rubrerythrin
MRRTIFTLLCLLIATTAFSADKIMTAGVRSVLAKALANEREAVIRYEEFAAKAADEGYIGAAALFRAEARAEKIHAQRFAAALKERGIPVPPESSSYKPSVGSTLDNLRTAAVAENAERDGIYREAIDTCRRDGDTEMAKLFDETRDVEVEHANLSAAAARNPESMKQPKTYYVCRRCGYTTDIDLARCPDCQHDYGLERMK